MTSHSPVASVRRSPQGWPRLPASEELHQAFEVLGRGGQVKLLRHVPEAPQPDPFDPEALLEFGKQRLNLIAGSPRALISRGAGEGADRLACGFLPVHEESPRPACRTALLLWTLSTLPFGGAVDVAARGSAQAAIAQRLARGAVVRVLVRRIAKLVPGEVLARLVAPINDRDVRLDALPEEPRQELATAVGFVGPQTLRAQAELVEMLEHLAGRPGLLPKARRGGDHIEDDGWHCR